MNRVSPVALSTPSLSVMISAEVAVLRSVPSGSVAQVGRVAYPLETEPGRLHGGHGGQSNQCRGRDNRPGSHARMLLNAGRPARCVDDRRMSKPDGASGT